MEIVKKFSKEQIADFLQRIYTNDKVKEIVSKATNVDKAEDLNDKIGEFLIHFAISTGDMSDESISSIAEKVGNTYLNSTTYLSRKDLFRKTVAPVIIDKVAKDLDLKSPYSLQDLILISFNIKLQNSNNHFSTHSFNGALFGEVNSNGFDISKEPFVNEFNLLAKYGLTTPFKKGDLYVCELSYASFGYLHRNPEKLYMALTGVKKQKDNQTQHDFLMECLVENIKELNIDNQKKNELLFAGKKIIDFYTTSNKVCMAIIEKPSVVSFISPKDVILNNLCALPRNSKIKLLNKKEFLNACIEKRVDDVEKILDEWEKDFPDSKSMIEKEKENAVFKYLTKYALNNFSTAYADGYVVKDGKLARDDFALACFDDSVKLYPQQHKEMAQRESKKTN